MSFIVQGQEITRAQLIEKLTRIHSNTKPNVWIGRNLEIIENTRIQRLIWTIFAYYLDCDWCKDLYGVDYAMTQKSLLGIRSILIIEQCDLELIDLFNATVPKYNSIVYPSYRIEDCLQTYLQSLSSAEQVVFIPVTNLIETPEQFRQLLNTYKDLSQVVFHRFQRDIGGFLEILLEEPFKSRIKHLIFDRTPLSAENVCTIQEFSMQQVGVAFGRYIFELAKNASTIESISVGKYISTPEQLQYVLDICPNITRIDFDNCDKELMLKFLVAISLPPYDRRIKHVNTSTVESISVGKCISTPEQLQYVLDMCPNITKIDFDSCSRELIHDFIITISLSSYAERIKHVKLHGINLLRDTDIKTLRRVPLKSLHIEANPEDTVKLTGQCLQSIASDQLEELNLNGLQNQLKDDDFDHLKNARLKKLYFASSQVTGMGLRKLDLSELTWLSIQERKYNEDVRELFMALNQAQNLDILTLDCSQITEEQWSALQEHHFKRLGLRNATPQFLQALSPVNLQQLNVLGISNHQLTISDLQALAVKKDESKHLAGTSTKGFTIQGLANCFTAEDVENFHRDCRCIRIGKN